MYFFVDESGHTGSNLFDAAQPILYYGVLSSRLNVNALAASAVESMRRTAGTPYLHANELGMAKLAPLASELIELQRRLDLRFDLYEVEKADYAYLQFFDQVFDQANNLAVPWTSYWTPMRYLLLLHVARLFDEATLEIAWKARVNPDCTAANTSLVEVCTTLLGRVPEIEDRRVREIVHDALTWAIAKPETLEYNANRRGLLQSITPNLMGFQLVMAGIGKRMVASGAKTATITVDQQSQFNKAQKSLADFYASIRDVPFVTGPGMPPLDFRSMPNVPIGFSSHKDAVGLELLDVFLWLFKRMVDGKEIAHEFAPLFRRAVRRGRTDEISLDAIRKRWEPVFLENEQKPLTDGQLANAREMQAQMETRRRTAIRDAGLVPLADVKP